MERDVKQFPFQGGTLDEGLLYDTAESSVHSERYMYGESGFFRCKSLFSIVSRCVSATEDLACVQYGRDCPGCVRVQRDHNYAVRLPMSGKFSSVFGSWVFKKCLKKFF